jgi:hypothetical protein
LAIAAFNIGTGLAVGWKVAPWVLHRKLLWRGLGVVGVLLYMGVMLGFNLAVAHYRYALGGVQPEQAPQLAFAALFAHPLAIADMHAWFLFTLGCAFSLVAAGDGWSMDDPYPGYGGLARCQAELIEEYAAQKQQLMADLEAVRNAALEGMKSAAEEIDRRRAEYHGILEAKARLQRTFASHLDYLEQCGNDLLATYHEANRRARSTPPPHHFSHAWAMPRPPEPASGPERTLGDPVLEAEIGQFFDQLHVKRQRVHTGYEAAVSAYKRIDELTPEVVRDGQFHTSQEETAAGQIWDLPD